MSEDNDNMKLELSDEKVNIDKSDLVNDILPPENTYDKSNFKKPIYDPNNHYNIFRDDHIPNIDEDIDSMIVDEESSEKENNGMTR